MVHAGVHSLGSMSAKLVIFFLLPKKMKEIFKKMWKIVKIAAVFVWRNRRGGCPLGWRNLGWRKDSPTENRVERWQ